MNREKKRVLRGSIAKLKDIITSLKGIYRGEYIRSSSF